MAKLIVARSHQFSARLRRFRILIDGRAAATIAAGKTAEIELAPGRHRITAQVDFMRSQPVEIEARPEGVHHLRVGSNAIRRGPLMLALYLPLLATPALIWLSLTGYQLFGDPFEASWFRMLLIPMVMLPVLLQVALMVLWRDRFLYLEEIRATHPADRPLPPPRNHPLRVRFTIRGLMIAVVVLAIVFAAGVAWTRYTRGTMFQMRADHHSRLEVAFREIERSLGAPAGWLAASRAAAKADYHAAMRRKYEEAAARHAVSVEPDPPELPWP